MEVTLIKKSDGKVRLGLLMPGDGFVADDGTKGIVVNMNTSNYKTIRIYGNTPATGIFFMNVGNMYHAILGSFEGDNMVRPCDVNVTMDERK